MQRLSSQLHLNSIRLEQLDFFLKEVSLAIIRAAVAEILQKALEYTAFIRVASFCQSSSGL